MAKKKPAVKKSTKKKAKLDFAQNALTGVEKLIGGGLADGIAKKSK